MRISQTRRLKNGFKSFLRHNSKIQENCRAKLRLFRAGLTMDYLKAAGEDPELRLSEQKTGDVSQYKDRLQRHPCWYKIGVTTQRPHLLHHLCW